MEFVRTTIEIKNSSGEITWTFDVKAEIGWEPIYVDDSKAEWGSDRLCDFESIEDMDSGRMLEEDELFAIVDPADVFGALASGSHFVTIKEEE